MTVLQRDLAALEPLTEALLATAGRLTRAELAEPSLCEGWTRGHVLTHVARNADALRRLVGWAATGIRVEMYPGGPGARDAEIEAGAGRGPLEQLEDLRTSAAALAAELPRLTGELAAPVVELRGGLPLDATDLPFMRLREVAFHHVDLDAGPSFADLPPDLVLRLLDDAVARLARSPRAPALRLGTVEGDRWQVPGGPGSGSAVEVTGSRAGMLLWLARRLPAGVSATGGDIPELPRGS